MRTVRLLLVRHATTAETRRAAFPSTTGAAPAAGCPTLDRAGAVAAAGLREALPRADRARTSHALRAVATASAAGLAAEADPLLAECDFGTWAGRTPEQVHAADAAGLGAWYADPSTAPHGGETFAAVRVRAREVLQRAIAEGGTTIAVTHGGFIKAALLEVLALPDTAVWRIDAAPCSVSELTCSVPGQGPAARAGAWWRLVRTGWTPALPGARASDAPSASVAPSGSDAPSAEGAKPAGAAAVPA